MSNGEKAGVSNPYWNDALKRGLLAALVVVILDFVTKHWALETLFARSVRIEVMPSLNFTPVWNRGVSFGLFASDSPYTPWLLSGFAIVVTIVLVLWLRKSSGWSAVYGLGLIIGGAVGNVIDRLRFGAVVDFIDVYWQTWHWPAFNIADSAITVGVGLLFLEAFGIGAGAKPEQLNEEPGERNENG